MYECITVHRLASHQCCTSCDSRAGISLVDVEDPTSWNSHVFVISVNVLNKKKITLNLEMHRGINT